MSAAAQRLGVQRAAVSRDIAQLEEECGARLLNRTTRSSGLTAAGEALHESCRRILEEGRQANELVHDQYAGLSGVVRLAATTAFGQNIVLPALLALETKHPRLQFELRMGDERTDLTEHGIDLAFRVGPMSSSDYKAKRIGTSRYILVSSPDYWAVTNRVTDPDQLPADEFARFSVQSSSHDWRIERGSEQRDLRSSGRITVNDSSALLQILLAGRTFCGVLEFVVAPCLESGTLVRLLPDWSFPYEIPLWAVWPRTRLGAKARLVLDTVVARLSAFVDDVHCMS